MTLNLVKLCVGAASVADLAQWQKERLTEQKKARRKPRIFHRTFQTPKRTAELLDGGSLYWVIKGVIEARQRLVGFEEGSRDDGSPCCLILLDPAIVPVRPVPRRAFQGWRYLSRDDAPPDLAGASAADLDALSPRMRRDLIDLGLL